MVRSAGRKRCGFCLSSAHEPGPQMELSVRGVRGERGVRGRRLHCRSARLVGRVVVCLNGMMKVGGIDAKPQGMPRKSLIKVIGIASKVK